MAFRPYLIDEITRDCVAGALTRREAIRRLGLLGRHRRGRGGDGCRGTGAVPRRPAGPPSLRTDTGSGSTAPLEEAEEIRFPGPDGELIGVLAGAEPPKGAVLVIHENRGLTPHIRSIPPRLAADGYTRAGDRPALRGGRHRQHAERGRRHRRRSATRRPSG